MGATEEKNPSDRASYAGGAREGLSAPGGSARSGEAGSAGAAAAVGAPAPAASVRIASVRIARNRSTHHCDAASESDPLSGRWIHTDRELFAASFNCRDYWCMPRRRLLGIARRIGVRGLGGREREVQL